MQHFLINSSICLFVLWLVYKLLLENTSWHQFKRCYLLAAMVISVVIPFVVVKTVVLPVTSFNPMSLPTFNQPSQEPLETVAMESSFTIDWSLVLLTVYAIGFIVMLFRFIKNLYGLRLKSTDQLDTFQNYRLISRPRVAVPHSFWNTIYVDIKEYQAGRIPLEVMEHEKAHLDQKHSMDVLLIELLMVFAWFNPLIYIIKYSMKLNHEFLADQAVIEQGVDTKMYQETLLQYAARSQNRSLANTFNFPIIKKRFTIMKTDTTTASGLLRSLTIVPVLALLVISCGKEVTKMEPIVNHDVNILGDNPNNVYGLTVDPDQPNGTVEYNGQTFKYEIQPDFNIQLMTMDGQMIDKKKNRVQVSAYYDAQEEVNILLENEADLKNRLANGKLQILDESTTYVEQDIEDKKTVLRGNSSVLGIDDLKSTDFSTRKLSKFTENDVLTYTIFPDYGGLTIKNLTEADITEYNELAIRYRKMHKKNPVTMDLTDELVRMQKIYNTMNADQKEMNEPWPLPYKHVRDSSPNSTYAQGTGSSAGLKEYIEQNEMLFYIDNRKVSKDEALANIDVFGKNGVQFTSDSEGNQILKIEMTSERIKKMPPPPPPSNQTTEQKLMDGSLKIMVNGKKATQKQLDYLNKLASDAQEWKEIRIYPSKEGEVDIISFYSDNL